MENPSNQISDVLTSNNFVNTPAPPSISQPNSPSFMSWIKTFSWSTWIIIFLVLAFLGFNILIFLAKGVGEAGSILNQIIDKIKDSGKLVNTLKQIINTSVVGTQGVIDTTANIADNALEKIGDATEIDASPQPIPAPIVVPQINTTPTGTVTNTVSNNLPNTNMPPMDVAQANTLNRALNNSQAEIHNINVDYQADDSYSTIQTGGQNKSGWCLIGEDRGFRSCAEVGKDDMCMSGKIFPTNEICINPSLRA